MSRITAAMLYQSGENSAPYADSQPLKIETLELAGADHLGASYASAEADGSWVQAADAFLRTTGSPDNGPQSTHRE